MNLVSVSRCLPTTTRRQHCFAAPAVVCCALCRCAAQENGGEYELYEDRVYIVGITPPGYDGPLRRDDRRHSLGKVVSQDAAALYIHSTVCMYVYILIR